MLRTSNKIFIAAGYRFRRFSYSNRVLNWTLYFKFIYRIVIWFSYDLRWLFLNTLLNQMPYNEERHQKHLIISLKYEHFNRIIVYSTDLWSLMVGKPLLDLFYMLGSSRRQEWDILYAFWFLNYNFLLVEYHVYVSLKQYKCNVRIHSLLLSNEILGHTCKHQLTILSLSKDWYLIRQFHFHASNIFLLKTSNNLMRLSVLYNTIYE